MNRTAFLAHLNVEGQTLEFWLEQQWLVPARAASDMSFSETDLARARLIQDLKTSFGVNEEGVDIGDHITVMLLSADPRLGFIDFGR